MERIVTFLTFYKGQLVSWRNSMPRKTNFCYAKNLLHFEDVSDEIKEKTATTMMEG